MQHRIAWGTALCALALTGVLCGAPAIGQGPRKAEAGSPAGHPAVKSGSALVLDQQSGTVLYGKNERVVVPIASLTKLMTAMVVLDAGQDPREPLTVTRDDVDLLKGTSSRLRLGAVLSRDDMLRIALMASENRAASALAGAYPGGRSAFVQAMNDKAQALAMAHTRFMEPTGLSSANVSTARDLARMTTQAYAYPKIREYSTQHAFEVQAAGRRLVFQNTNRLVDKPGWDIGLSKTGFINEAGRCLILQAQLAGRATIIVLLDSWGRYTRLADAARIRQWVEARAPGSRAAASRMSTRLSGSLSGPGM